ncbi:SPASM domain-containing protein [Candidatus Woesearchaeota archaeon]|nr:SPASM domain-containing protein [Candidatus Woesearchaeota archaeon]
MYKNQIKKIATKIKIPGYILIEPYNVCNARCTICPYKKMTRKKQLMQMKLFKKIIDDCKNNNIKTIDLTFYNEAFLDPLLFERIKYVKDNNLRIYLFSNGSVLNKQNIDRILEMEVDDISFSLDGAAKKTYEKIRKGLNYDTVKENILNLIKERDKRKLKKPRIELNYVITNENLAEIEKFKGQWKNLADNIRFSVVDTREQENKLPKKYKVKKSKKPWPCTRIWEAMQVMSNGKVVMCCVDYDGEVIVGDLNKQTIKEIWDSDKFKRLRLLHLKNKADKIPLCRKCSWLYRHNRVNWWFFN